MDNNSKYVCIVFCTIFICIASYAISRSYKEAITNKAAIEAGLVEQPVWGRDNVWVGEEQYVPHLIEINK